MVNTPEQAIAAAAAQSKNGPRFGTGMCLAEVRAQYGAPGGTIDAATAWANAGLKHRTTDPASIPRGVPVFWTGGSSGHGHIAIASGSGYCWSTDILRDGYFDHVPITAIHNAWGLTLVGWTEDLNGVHVWTPPAPPVEKPQEDPVLTKARAIVQRIKNSLNDPKRHLVDLDDLNALIDLGHQPEALAAKDFRNTIQAGVKAFGAEVKW